MNIHSPIHVGTVNGQQLRLFKTPNDDGRPDFPWHSVDDLGQAFGLNRQRRRMMLQGMQKYGVFRTVATPDGLIVIGPHYTAQGAISAIAQIIGDSKSKQVDSDYTFAFIEACTRFLLAGCCSRPMRISHG